jgi:polysaccharide pyruvyl transferase WcaK-like protein
MFAFLEMRTAFPGGIMNTKRIGLFGNFGGGNLGNEGSLEAMLRFLQQTYPTAEVVCICAEPDIIREQFGITTLPIYAPRSPNGGVLAKIRVRIADHVAMFRNIGKFRVLLIPGTGILDDFGERPVAMPYMLFLMALMAKLRGVNVAFVSIGAGPIAHPLSRWFMKSAARMATYRSYRDQISKDFMASVGINVSNDPVYPDLAFRLPDPAPIEQSTAAVLTVGLGVMTYRGWRAGGDEAIYAGYLKKIATFAIWLLNQGYRIRLLIGEPGDERAVDDLKLALAKEVRRADRSVVTNTPHSLHDLMTQIASVDVVVATRFHNVLCALKVGKPTISLSYAEKNDVMMAAMGLGEFCQHVEQFDVDVLIQQFNKLIGQREAYEKTVIAMSASICSQLEQQEQFLVDNFL